MKAFALAIIINVSILFRCWSETNLLNRDFWDQYDSQQRTPRFEESPLLAMNNEALGTPSEVSPLAAPVEDLFKKNYWFLVLLDTKEVFTAPVRWDSRDWLLFGGIAAGIGTVMAFDQDIERGIRHARSDTMTSFFDNVQPFGNEYAVGVVGAFYAWGEIFKDPKAKNTALDSIAATAIASGIVVNSMKYVVGRGRPTDNKGAYDFEPFSGRDSFLSGHTTEAFALASVITDRYPDPWVQFTAYGVAGTVGYARLNNNRHWPSDVLAGAVVGTFVGKTVVRFNRNHRKVQLQPIVGPDIRGAQIAVGW
jgi:membrane-associated phospholipid phosphatase